MSPQPQDTSLQSRFFELADLATPYSIRVAATLGLVDLLPASTEQLAKQVDANPAALHLLLQHLAIRGLLTETAPGTFAVTGLGEFLGRDHPFGLRAALDLEGGLARSDQAITRLLHSVRTGRAAYPELFGRSFWADLTANPDMEAQFDQLTAATKPPGLFDEIAAGYDDWPSGHVVDVGGGTGEMLIAALRARPDLRGSLVERAATAEAARHKLAAAGLGSRATAIAGDIFQPLPAADLYLLVNVLHDWNDEDALAILRRCAEAGGPTARMLVVERLDTSNDYIASTLNLRMLVTFGGRQRTMDAFNSLAASVDRTARLVHQTRWHALVEFTPETPS
ncbi:MAG: 2,7-dihydroxy-5-methyl-naphthoate 7-O-methyltransferase [Mycobacteriales bacterium]|jgi:hypothetical protein